MDSELERFIQDREELIYDPPEKILAFQLPDVKFFAPIVRPIIKPTYNTITALYGEVRNMTDDTKADFLLRYMKNGMDVEEVAKELNMQGPTAVKSRLKAIVESYDYILNGDGTITGGREVVLLYPDKKRISRAGPKTPKPSKRAKKAAADEVDDAQAVDADDDETESETGQARPKSHKRHGKGKEKDAQNEYPTKKRKLNSVPGEENSSKSKKVQEAVPTTPNENPNATSNNRSLTTAFQVPSSVTEE